MKIPDIKRHTGIETIGDIPWGTHLCQFYKTKEDLLEVLVPYFREGLRNNEFCLCVTSEPLDVNETYVAFQKAIPDFERCFEKGHIEIIPYSKWYIRNNRFEEKEVLNGWISKLEKALLAGFDGLRLSGNTFWLEKKDWKSFYDYEKTVNEVIGQYSMIALCTYSLEKCRASDVIDVVANHEFALIKRDGSWVLIENTERKKTLNALIESENRLRIALEAANFGTWDYDVATGKTVRSLRHDQIFGYQELQPEWSISIEERHILPEDLPRVQYAHAQALKTGKMSWEARIRWADNSIHWISALGSAHYDAAGKPVRLFGVVEDITERKMVEEALKDSQEKLKLALTTSNVGIWDWNLKTDEIFWDKGVIAMQKKEDNSPVSTFNEFEALIHEDDLLHVKKAINRALNEGNPYNTIFRIRSSGDDPIYINIKALVYRDENGIPFRMLGVCIDVTEMTKSTEKTLLKLNEELARSNKDLQSFSYIASHDLQEPLRMVSSFTQLLSQKYKDKLDETAQEYIHFAVDGANRMYEQINGLLTYSKIDSKGDCFKVVNMAEVLERVKLNLGMALNEKNASFTWDELPAVFADESQIIQLIQNLVTNSLKFCLENPKIHLSCRLENEKYIFSLSDNGIGIEPQYFERIFQIFQRLNSKEQYNGTGIGLAICKRIVERHKGQIWLESEPGQGSTFYFSLPKAKKDMQVTI